MKDLTAVECELRKIFSSDYEFTIPDYQSQYAWWTPAVIEARQADPLVVLHEEWELI